MAFASPIFFALACCLLHLSHGFDWKQCGEGSFSVNDVTLTPQQVKPGDTAEFKITADSGIDVQQGTVRMVVTYAGIPIWTQTDNLCEKATCPVAAGGPVDVVYQQLFPIFTPPGQYVVTLKGDSGTTPLFCVAVTFQVVPPTGAAAVKAGAAGIHQAASALLQPHRKELV